MTSQVIAAADAVHTVVFPTAKETTMNSARTAAGRRLAFSGYAIIATGLVFWAASWIPGLSEAADRIYGLALGENTWALDQAARLNMAILGGVMAGWGATIVGLSKPGLTPQNIGRAIFAGMVVWFVVDSIGSVLTGGWRNVVLNAGFFVLIAPAAWMAATRAPDECVD